MQVDYSVPGSSIIIRIAISFWCELRDGIAQIGIGTNIGISRRSCKKEEEDLDSIQ